MVRRKLIGGGMGTRNPIEKKNSDNGTRNNDANDSDANNANTGPSYSCSNLSSKFGNLHEYRSVLLIVLAWCTVQMYTDSMAVQWSAFFAGGDANSSSSFDWNSFWATATAISGRKASSGYREPGQLRFDWPNLQAKSAVGRELTQLRQNCSLPLKYHYFGEGGLGAELHAYSYSMCWAYQYNWRLYGIHNMYYDKEACAAHPSEGQHTVSQMTCYFGNLEMTCADDEKTATKQQASPDVVKKYKSDYWNLWKDKKRNNICEALAKKTGVRDHVEMRSGVMEAMFTSGISPVLLKEAQRQHALVFPNGAPPSHQLITVHVRWGDKGSEMKLVQIQDYMDAINRIASYRGLEPHEVHVYLGTEDPAAVQAFRQAMNPQWTLYLDQFYVDMLPYRNNKTQEVAGLARSGMGRTGLLALGSLLVALEANHYILTSASNWSRLINELRRSIVKANGCPPPAPPATQEGDEEDDEDEEDEDCTTVIDLRKADFWMDLNTDGGGV